MKNNLAKNTILLSIGTVLNKGLTFFMILLFSRWLTTEDYGTFDLLCTYVTMLIPVLSLASGNGIFRFGIDANKEDRKIYITSGLIIFLIGIGLFGIIIGILYLIIKSPLLIPFYIMLIGEFLNQYLQYFLRSIKKINIYSFCSAISTIFTFIFVTIFIKVFNLGLFGIIYGYACGYIIGDVLIIIITKFCSYLTKKWSFSHIKQLIHYSLPLIPNSISWWIVNASDRTIIKIFLGAASNGIYAIAYKIPNLCTSIFNSFSVAWQEAAIEMNDHEERKKYFNNVYNKMFLILISLCCGILSCNFLLFGYIFDIRYIDARLYTPILITSVMFTTISQFFGGIQISIKDSKANGVTTVVGAIVNIIVHLSLIKFIGLYAASISTLVSTLIIVLLRKKMIKKVVDVNIDKSNYKYFIFYIYMCICAFLCQKLPLFFNILNLLLACCFFIFINKKMIFKILKKFHLKK